MLVIKRKTGETVVLQDAETGHEIAVLHIRGMGQNHVRLGIDSSRDKVLILRGELLRGELTICEGDDS